jgi:hypothetical protein
MFKYNISISFYRFTQYYENIKCYYEIDKPTNKLSIFRCAQYKKEGVADTCPASGINRVFCSPKTGLQCIVWCDSRGPVRLS